MRDDGKISILSFVRNTGPTWTMRALQRFNADSDELHPAESRTIEAPVDTFHGDISFDSFIGPPKPRGNID